MNFFEMTGYDFEDYISELLKRMGFTVEQTAYTNDGGIDIVAFYNKPIFYGKYIIQCKNWQGSVGAPEIRDLYGVVTDQRANKGILITPSDFTEQAYDFAKGKNIELINGSILRDLIDKYITKNEGSFKRDSGVDTVKGLNLERYAYLLKKINDDYKNEERYIEVDGFLLNYIQNNDFDISFGVVLDRLVENQDNLIKKCYNTKSKNGKKAAALLKKANYLLLSGKLVEALDLILDNYGLEKMERGKLRVYNLTYYELSGNFGYDVLTRNLYNLFKVIGYNNGIRIISELPIKELNFFSYTLIDKKKADDVMQYQLWDDYSQIYVPHIFASKPKHSSKGFEIEYRLFEEGYLVIDTNKIYSCFYSGISNQYFESLDKIMIRHGFLK